MSQGGIGEAELRDALVRRATAVFGARADAIKPGEVMHAIFSVAARIGEEVTRRLDQVPDKQSTNFYAAMGLGREPPVPAKLPVAITLADNVSGGEFVDAGLKLQAVVDGAPPVTFETLAGVDLVSGAIVQLCAADLSNDRIFLAPDRARVAVPVHAERVLRGLVSGAGTGMSVLQIEPATSLAPGAVLQIGDPPSATQHTIVKIENNLVTIDPPLTSTVIGGATVREVTSFVPWAESTRNRQSHRLFLGHSTLLDVPSATSIRVFGLTSDQEFEWHWFGKLKETDTADWQKFDARIEPDGGWWLDKPFGKPEKTTIAGNNTFWLRATLNGLSTGTKTGSSIRLGVAGSRDCVTGADLVCDKEFESVAFEAVAVTTPVVVSKPFYPFGREPRLYDSFHVGCNEAFGKVHAKVRLCFTLGGAVLGRMAIVESDASRQVFAVGTDGLLYRATFDVRQSSFDAVPMPPELGGVGVASQAAVAARIDNGAIRLALAGRGCVFVTSFDARAKLTPDIINWQKLSIGDADPGGEVIALYVRPGGPVLTLWRDPQKNGARAQSLLTWTRVDAAPQVTADAIDLIPVQGESVDAALLIVKDASNKWKLTALRGDLTDDLCLVESSKLPQTMRSAWSWPIGRVYVVGGWSAQAQSGELRDLQIAEVSPDGIVPAEGDLGAYPALPIAFEPPYDEDGWPVAVIATPEPVRIVASADDPSRGIDDRANIGASTNTQRHFITSGGWTVVQHPGQGLYFRYDLGARHSLGSVALPGRTRLVVDEDVLSDDVRWLADMTVAGPRYQGFECIVLAATGKRLLRALAKTDTIDLPASFTPLKAGTGKGTLQIESGNKISLTTEGGSTPPRRKILILVEGTSDGGASVWTLIPDQDGIHWTKPQGFPSDAARWQQLVRKGRAVSLTSANTEEWFETPADAFKEVVTSELRAIYDEQVTVSPADGIVLDGLTVFPLPFALVERDDVHDTDVARFVSPASPWSRIGPNEPANPDLSWEYWNGSAWWTLDAHELRDTTADLQIDGGIFFTVPDDLAETDVGGRKNRWIRGRLIGGEYGQARITIDKTGDDAHSTQSVTRDLSAIRAPYVTELKLSYCAMDALPPDTILTEDNLGTIDQTNANRADLPVHFFAPVSTILYPPVPAAPEYPAGEGACCETWTEPAPPPVPPATTPRVARALMIGFNRQPEGDAVSLYVDAEATGRSAELKALAFRAGTFSSIDIVGDTSSGMNESGVILVRIPELDLAQLFGQSAYWIALAPTGDAEQWSPWLYGLYPNGVMTASVETRSNESIGSSTGAPDQRFRLVSAPVDPDTLDLWIAEPVGSDDAKALGAEDTIEGMPGPWVRWTQVVELPVSEALNPDRLYTLDALTGEVSFGNGRNALAPPMGSAILARSYQHVIGSDANAVAPGAALSPISPIAGVDKVQALDFARGGADAETVEDSLRRAPAKLRNADRLMTLADIEEFVLARLQWVAQARAENRQGRTRLVVAGRAEKVVPAPSRLRGVRDSIAGKATFGVGSRLDVVAPRFLPLAVSVTLEHDAGADVATLIEDARDAIVEFFDHETGGYDGRGWPVGAAPEADDVAGALAGVTERSVLKVIAIARKDNNRALPSPLPGDVLVRVSEGDVAVETEVAT